MVGHTGNFDATVAAMEALDHAVGDVVDALMAAQGIAVILADHGNAEEMWTEKNGVRMAKTAHTLNPVPFVIVDPRPTPGYQLAPGLAEAGLANVAATLCYLLGWVPPADFAPAVIG
jgi:2,3-bisphosphoglycerate-independent phosphoglycerate mutase